MASNLLMMMLRILRAFGPFYSKFGGWPSKAAIDAGGAEECEGQRPGLAGGQDKRGRALASFCEIDPAILLQYADGNSRRERWLA
jgi:hypothetical protein